MTPDFRDPAGGLAGSIDRLFAQLEKGELGPWSRDRNKRREAPLAAREPESEASKAAGSGPPPEVEQEGPSREGNPFVDAEAQTEMPASEPTLLTDAVGVEPTATIEPPPLGQQAAIGEPAPLGERKPLEESAGAMEPLPLGELKGLEESASPPEPAPAIEPAPLGELTPLGGPTRLDEPAPLGEPTRLEEPALLAELTRLEDPTPLGEPTRLEQPASAAEPPPLGALPPVGEPAPLGKGKSREAWAAAMEPLPLGEQARIEEPAAAMELAPFGELTPLFGPAASTELAPLGEPTPPEEPGTTTDPIPLGELPPVDEPPPLGESPPVDEPPLLGQLTPFEATASLEESTPIEAAAPLEESTLLAEPSREPSFAAILTDASEPPGESTPLEEPAPLEVSAPFEVSAPLVDSATVSDPSPIAEPSALSDMHAAPPLASEPDPAITEFAAMAEPFAYTNGAGGEVPAWAAREGSVEQVTSTLEQAVRSYLWGPDPAPRELATRIEELCQRLAGAGELQPVLGAVERLALGTEGPESTALQLARRILTPQVSLGLAVMLGASAKDGPKRERLVAAIVRLGAPMVPAVARLLTESTERGARRAYIEALSALGPIALPAVRELAGDSRWFVVRNAILLLRDHGESEVEFISAALQHDDPRVRKEALIALAHVGGDSAVPLVASKLADPDSDVRKSAAIAAGAVRSNRAVKPLLERLDKEAERDVIESVLLALGQIGDASAVPAIEKRSAGGFFAKPHSSVRVAAYRALAAIGTPQAKKRLSEAANDRDPVVREAVDRLIRGG